MVAEEERQGDLSLLQSRSMLHLGVYSLLLLEHHPRLPLSLSCLAALPQDSRLLRDLVLPPDHSLEELLRCLHTPLVRSLYPQLRAQPPRR